MSQDARILNDISLINKRLGDIEKSIKQLVDSVNLVHFILSEFFGAKNK